MPKPQLEIDAHTVKHSIITTPKMKLKPDAVRVVTCDTLVVSPPDSSRWVWELCLLSGGEGVIEEGR